MEKLLPLTVIVFFSNLVEACAGFGATLLAIIFGARFLPIEELVPMLVPLNLALSATIVFRYRRDVDWSALLARILPYAGAALPIGILIFNVAPGRVLKLAFGVVVAALGLLELATAARARRGDGGLATPRKRLSPWQGRALLVAGGIMQGLYASGGPFIVYYASREIPDKRKFRTTLATLWLVLNLVLLASLAIGGKVNAASLRDSAVLLPPVLLGMLAGMKIHDRVSEATFRIAVYALLALAGASLAYRTYLTEW